MLVNLLKAQTHLIDSCPQSDSSTRFISAFPKSSARDVNTWMISYGTNAVISNMHHALISPLMRWKSKTHK